MGPEVHDTSPTGETSWTVCDVAEPEPEPEGPNWCKHENNFLYNYAGDAFTNLEDAQEACLQNDQCNGITQVNHPSLSRNGEMIKC